MLLLNIIAQSISDKKGFNIIALDVRGLSSITDYLVIAEGNVDRHVMAIARNVQQDLLEQGEKALYVEGLKNGDWIVLDYGEVMVHLFMPGMREKYQLETLWKESKLVDLEIDMESKVNELWKKESLLQAWELSLVLGQTLPTFTSSF